MLALFPLFTACVTADPPPAVPVLPPPASPGERAAKAKGKGAKGGRTAKGAKGGKAGEAAPVGVTGPGTVALVLEVTDTSTSGKLELTFADASTHTVDLRPIPGKCTELPPVAREHDGASITPFFTQECVTPKATLKVHVAQVGDKLMTIAELPDPAGGEPRSRPVAAVPLAAGVVLTRKPAAP